MDFNNLATELVREVRGVRSQSSLNRKLGYRGNQLQRWEAGTRRISWTDFVRVCTACGIDLVPHMTRFLTGLCDPMNAADLVNRIIGASTLVDLARDTGISRFAISRWQQGKSSPGLAEMLHLVQHCQFTMFEFLQGFVDLRRLPSAKEEFEQRQRRKQIYYRRPVVVAVLCALRLDEYKALPAHQQGYLARKIGISVDDELQALAELVEVGKIRLVGAHYEALDENLEITDSKDFRTFVAYWLQRGLDYTINLPNPYPVLGFGMEIHPTSAATLRKIRDEYLTYYGRVRALLTQDHGPRDRIYVFNSLFYDLEQGGTVEAAAATLAQTPRSPRRPPADRGRDAEPVIPFSP